MKEYKIIAPEGKGINEEALKEGRIEFIDVKKELPKTWEELGEVAGYWVSSSSEARFEESLLCEERNKNLWPSKEEAEASIALAQLCQLRDAYNEGWKPDWGDANYKYSIFMIEDEMVPQLITQVSKILCFKTKELRDLFLENFKDLIETAKPLL